MRRGGGMSSHLTSENCVMKASYGTAPTFLLRSAARLEKSGELSPGWQLLQVLRLEIQSAHWVIWLQGQQETWSGIKLKSRILRWEQLAQCNKHRSATPWNPLTGGVDINHSCSSGKPWLLVFMWMFLTHKTWFTVYWQPLWHSFDEVLSFMEQYKPVGKWCPRRWMDDWNKLGMNVKNTKRWTRRLYLY